MCEKKKLNLQPKSTYNKFRMSYTLTYMCYNLTPSSSCFPSCYYMCVNQCLGHIRNDEVDLIAMQNLLVWVTVLAKTGVFSK